MAGPDEDGAEAKVPLKIGRIGDFKGTSFLGSRLLRHFYIDWVWALEISMAGANLKARFF